MTRDLYTTADVKKERDRLVKLQKGIDPILKEPFKEPPACDHDHVTQKVRGALGRNSNAFEGKVFNAFVRCLRWQTDLTLSEILRNLADYLETDTSANPHHPAWMKRIETDFRKLTAKAQGSFLLRFGESGKNQTERVAALKKVIKSSRIGYLKTKEILEECEKENP